MSSKKVLFIGSKNLGLKVLSEIYQLSHDSIKGVITIDDRDDTRTVFHELSCFCDVNNVPLYVVGKRVEFNTLVKEIKPDLCIVVCWYWIINKVVLDSVPMGFIGVHGSILPKYRGGSPLVWQVINGEDRGGFSIFSFDEGMDSGDVWGQVEIEIDPNDYIRDVLDKVENEVVNWFRENFKGLLEEKIMSNIQNHEDATYCAQRFPFDGEINWGNNLDDIYNFIRAQSEPYPGSFTFFKGKKLTIWRARKSDLIYYGRSGQVVRVLPKGVYVTCGDNRPIILEKVQLEGKPIQDASKVIKSIKTRL